MIATHEASVVGDRITKAQQQALAWLADHNGTGVWAIRGTLLAGGEIAPVRRMTWNTLRDLDCVAFVDRTRIALTDVGRHFASVRKWEGA